MNSTTVFVLLMVICLSFTNGSRLVEQLRWLKRHQDQVDIPSPPAEGGEGDEDDVNNASDEQPTVSLSGTPQVRGMGWDESAEDVMEQRSIGKRDLDSFRQQALNKHNEYRRKHCVPVMTLDSNLNSVAQQYAQYLAKNNLFQHSGKQGMGENLYMSSTTGQLNMNGADAVKAWYDEIKYYNYNSPGFSMSTGHFTQVVWRKSNRLGIGAATATNGGWTKLYVVANYAPSGNYMGEFSQNVPRLC